MKKSIIFILTFLSLLGCEKKIKINFVEGVEFNANILNVSKFEIDKEENLGNEKNLNLKASNSEVLKLKVTEIKNIDEARKKIIFKSNELRSMYSPQQVPYQGQVSHSVECLNAVDISQKIEESAVSISIFFNVTATDSFIYASCLSSQELFKSQYVILYCKKTAKFIEAKYFYPKDKIYYSRIISCN